MIINLHRLFVFLRYGIMCGADCGEDIRINGYIFLKRYGCVALISYFNFNRRRRCYSRFTSKKINMHISQLGSLTNKRKRLQRYSISAWLQQALCTLKHPSLDNSQKMSNFMRRQGYPRVTIERILPSG